MFWHLLGPMVSLHAFVMAVEQEGNCAGADGTDMFLERIMFSLFRVRMKAMSTFSSAYSSTVTHQLYQVILHRETCLQQKVWTRLCRTILHYSPSTSTGKHLLNMNSVLYNNTWGQTEACPEKHIHSVE